jgi:hypothetical protein
MRTSDLRDGILTALLGGTATSSALQAAVPGAEQLHDELWGGALRGLVRDGMIVKELGEYRATDKSPLGPSASASPVSTAPPALKVPQKVNGKIDRSADGLREALFDAIDGLRSGAIDEKRANAIANQANVILKSIDTQVAFERLRLEKKAPEALPPMKLVANDQAK